MAQPIEDATNALYRQWGVGKKGKDEGIMFLLAIQDRRDRIEVGYGLEPILPDGFDGSIARSIQPLLRQGAYGPAMIAAAQQIGSAIARAKGVAPQARRAPALPREFSWPWASVAGDHHRYHCVALAVWPRRQWWRILGRACFSVTY